MDRPPFTTPPASTCRLIYDTGPIPLLVRIMTLPFAAMGVMVLYLILRDGALRVAYGRTLIGFVASALLVLLFVKLWFWRSSILFDAEQRALVQRHRGLFGVSDRRTPASEVAQIVLRPGRMRARQFWDVYLVLTSGRRGWLARLDDEQQAHQLARVLAEALGVPSAPA